MCSFLLAGCRLKIRQTLEALELGSNFTIATGHRSQLLGEEVEICPLPHWLGILGGRFERVERHRPLCRPWQGSSRVNLTVFGSCPPGGERLVPPKLHIHTHRSGPIPSRFAPSPAHPVLGPSYLYLKADTWAAPASPSRRVGALLCHRPPE